MSDLTQTVQTPDLIREAREYADSCNRAGRSAEATYFIDTLTTALEASLEREARLREALRAGFEVMNNLGDILNNMDAVTEEDEEWATPRWNKVRAALGDQP